MPQIAIALENVTTDFPIYGRQPSLRTALIGRAVGGLVRKADSGGGKRVTIRALDNINLTIRHGDRLGIIGHNGAGKSTLLRVLAGIYEPTSGRMEVNGRVSPLFITAPGLELDDTGYDNIVTCGLLLGMSRAEIAAKIDDIQNFAELGDYISLPVRTYSTGMIVRLGFAIATAIDPDILLLDEGLGAGDARFAKRAEQRVKALISRASSMVLASHSTELIRRMCNRVILLHHGRLVSDGAPEEVFKKYGDISRQEEPEVTEPDEPVPILSTAVLPGSLVDESVANRGEKV